MIEKAQFSFFWFRRDLRLSDNTALTAALQSGLPVVPVFIFDTTILNKLKDRSDRRVYFIHQQVAQIKKQLRELGSDLWIGYGDPEQIWQKWFADFAIAEIHTNRDYEPQAIARDQKIAKLAKAHGAKFLDFVDQVVCDPDEILKSDGKPYTVFTSYFRRWQQSVLQKQFAPIESSRLFTALCRGRASDLPTLKQLGFIEPSNLSDFPTESVSDDLIRSYAKNRDYPALPATSHLGLHLRFGTVSIRDLVSRALMLSETWLSELVWREFFMMILKHFPRVVNEPFKPAYAKIAWRDSQEDFERWCVGETGYPLVDAGMRELNTTGFMHNRVRMVVASFLTKHLLIDWRKGEQYFAEKLLDFDLSANNGNWQWAAGCGCDAAPYFRVFNPELQQKKFDPQNEYVRKWAPEYFGFGYPKPMVEHKFARERVLAAYASALGDQKAQ